MAEMTEKAFLKQPKVFLCSKKTGKGKRPGKGGNRYWKSIGLGLKERILTRNAPSLALSQSEAAS